MKKWKNKHSWGYLLPKIYLGHFETFCETISSSTNREWTKKIQVYKYGHLGASNYNLTTWGVHNKKMHNLNFDVLIQNYCNFKK